MSAGCIVCRHCRNSVQNVESHMIQVDGVALHVNATGQGSTLSC
jgi:hypothetical protein